MPVLSIADVKKDLKGVTVLVRSSLNVPLVNGVVANAFRIARAVDTINHLRARGARIVLISHIDGSVGASLLVVAEYLKQFVPLMLVPDVVGDVARKAVRAMHDSDVVMLENVRRDKGEEANDEHFARKLASLGDVFVNDDFATAHRKHASIVTLPKLLPSYAGIQFMAEMEGLSVARSPQSPSLAIIGGAKFITKEPLLKELLKTYDHVFVGGALSSDFFKARGYEVGRSLVSGSVINEALLKNSKLILPSDVTVLGVDGRDVKTPDSVLSSEVIYDIGPLTLAKLAPLILKAKIILWNGPMGNFEQGFREMTEATARLVAESPGITIVGGGDTIAAIQRLNLEKKFTFTSTAGGAMLDYLANGTLPGVEALRMSRTIV